MKSQIKLKNVFFGNKKIYSIVINLLYIILIL